MLSKRVAKALAVPVIGAVIAAGGAAYAEVGDVPTEEPVAEEPVVEEPVVEEPVAEEPVVEEPVLDEVEVHEHPDNHGKLVSETAHSTPPGPGHGQAVSEVARSKSKHQDTTEPSTEELEGADEDVTEEEAS